MVLLYIIALVETLSISIIWITHKMQIFILWFSFIVIFNFEGIINMLFGLYFFFLKFLIIFFFSVFNNCGWINIVLLWFIFYHIVVLLSSLNIGTVFCLFYFWKKAIINYNYSFCFEHFWMHFFNVVYTLTLKKRWFILWCITSYNSVE